MKTAFFYHAPIGQIGIAEENGAITNLFFGNTVKPTAYECKETPVIQQAATQIQEYFDGKRKTFSLPLRPEGTTFECAVWQILQTIPYGETKTYGEIAALLNKPLASRAVGRANGRNPISILIPCHRVIGKNGTLTGYAGGLAAKKLLLDLEQKSIDR